MGLREAAAFAAAVVLVACGPARGGASDDATSTDGGASSGEDETTEGPAEDLPDTPAPQVVQLDMDGSSVCAVLDDGRAKCWGDGSDGRLGLGDEEDIGDDEYPSEAPFVDVGGPVERVVLDGAFGACAILSDGRLRCWGRNAYGQLGYGHTEQIGDDETPSTQGDVPLGGRVLDGCVPGGWACAILDGGGVRCWGLNSARAVDPSAPLELTIGDDEPASAAPLVPLSAPAVQLACGNGPCALLDTGRVECWGDGFQAWTQEGSAVFEPMELPVSDVIHIGASGRRFCAVSEGGEVRCWGTGAGYPEATGQVPHPYEHPWDTPPPIDLGGPAEQVVLGTDHTCALMESGEVRCWGSSGCALGLGACPDGESGEWCSLGVYDPPSAAPPVDLGARVVSLAAGAVGTCAVLETGSVMCWGAWGKVLGFCPRCPATTAPCDEFGDQCCVGDDETPMSVGPVRVF